MKGDLGKSGPVSEMNVQVPAAGTAWSEKREEHTRKHETKEKGRTYDMIKTHSHIRGREGEGEGAEREPSSSLALVLGQAQPSPIPYVPRFQAKQASNQSTHPFPLALRSHENAESISPIPS
jgi:hypothetical protein